MPGAKVLESGTAYAGKVIDVVVERIVPPHDGAAEARVEVVRHEPSVGIIAMPGGETIVLVRQYRHAAGRFLWELPAGSVDKGEDAETAARRECQEELGLVPGKLERLASLFPLPGYCSEEMTFFRATGLRRPGPADAAAAQDEDEHIEAREFTIGEIRRMVREGEIADLKTAAALVLIGG